MASNPNHVLLGRIGYFREESKKNIPSVNDRTIDMLVTQGLVTDPSLEKILRDFDRDFFMPISDKDFYNNTMSVGSSQRINDREKISVYIHVIDQLELRPGMSFLCVPCGNGFLNALAGFLIGPQGVNHGLSLFNIPVNKARNNVTKFMDKADVINDHEFCVPIFEKGNVFLLEDKKYDRVYCGRECPPYYQRIILKLLKNDGFAIMVHDDNFIKFHPVVDRVRRSNYLDLVRPVPTNFVQRHYVDETVPNLPSVNPPTLLQMARLAVRNQIKKTIMHNHGIFTDRPLFTNFMRKCLSRFDMEQLLSVHLTREIGRTNVRLDMITENNDRSLMAKYEKDVDDYTERKKKLNSLKNAMIKSIEELEIPRELKAFVAFQGPYKK